jgi:hypothetical protein
MEKIIQFDTMPARDDLIKEFKKFVAKNPKFKEMIKIGKTSDKKLNSRYREGDKYEKLSLHNVFCKSKSEKVALAIEKSLQAYAKENEKLYSAYDLGNGGYSKDKCSFYLVYVTVLKPDLRKCPLSTCLKVSPVQAMKNHVKSHGVIVDIERGNKLLSLLKVQPLETTTEPKKVSPTCVG